MRFSDRPPVVDLALLKGFAYGMIALAFGLEVLANWAALWQVLKFWVGRHL